MAQSDDTAILTAAEKAVEAAGRAEELRHELRWSVKPGDSDREGRIAACLLELRDVMEPVRSYLGRLAWPPPTPPEVERALRAASAEVQYQRKQLKKMRR